MASRWYSLVVVIGLLTVASIAALLHPLTLTAADAPVPGPLAQLPPTAFQCRWIDAPPTLDGKADEPGWTDAVAIDQFYLPWLGDKARAARTSTSAKLMWDREYLYFFAQMQDADLYGDITEQDGQAWDNDVFELFFQPDATKSGYYELQVTPAGTKMDMFIPRRGSTSYRRFRHDGEFHWDVKVRLDGTLNNYRDQDTSWSLEGRIPWTDFLRTGGRPAIGEEWKFALCRYDHSTKFDGPELSTCAPLKTTGAADFHAHEKYATLKFVGPEQSKHTRPRGIEKKVKVTTSTVKGWPDPPSPYRTQRVYPKLGLNNPIHVTHLPGTNQILLIDQGGKTGQSRIARFTDQPDVEKLESVIELSDLAYDITFHPQFAANGYLYVGSNGSRDGAAKMTRVTRYTIDRKAPYTFDPKSAVVIIEWASDGHNGAAVTFGHDGMLYVTSGDGTSDSDTNVVGQDMTTLLAKLLRIDVDHPAPGQQYSVPKDNPYVNLAGARPETWAYGLRNPWRMTTDRERGHIWVAQNGQDLYEQAFLVRKGDNFGWSVTEGSNPFYLTRKVGPTPIVKPTLEHHHSEARSLTGGIVYYGPKLPDLKGTYIYGDYSTGKIWGAIHDGTTLQKHWELVDSPLQITGFGTDSKGDLLICDHRGGKEGALYTLVPTPKDVPASTFPKKLSDSGLFASIKEHRMVPGVIPYSVNAQFWSDGAYKQRYFMLPTDDAKIDFTTNRGWNFPDETVIVKSFALEMEKGNPASRRWIETRFMTRQQGEWFGYSYLWNDEQTDATLIDAKGMDKSFDIRTTTGVQPQTWHYPSRAECMVCHSRAANYVLGLCESQMNREHDYDGVKDHQFRVLEHLNLLKISPLEDQKTLLRDRLRERGQSDPQIKEYVEKHGTPMPDQRQWKAQDTMLGKSPVHYKKLVNPYDKTQDITLRAKSYLHSNCASCHIEAGGGNAAMELEFQTPLEKMRIFDTPPVHQNFNLPDARLLAPGRPESSILLHRISQRDRNSMPPLSTNVVDVEAKQLMEQWIRSLAK